MSSLKIIPLGGMGTVTKNMFVYETDREILIIDCGIGFPETSVFGIDLLLPDINYLKDKQDKIVGMLLSHGHDDHIAGIPYIIPQLKPFPIYASRLTAAFVKDRCRDDNIKVNLQPINNQPFKIGSFTILPIKVTHSVPDARHFAITTPAGTIYHGSDFKFDPKPVDGVLSDFDTIKKVGDQGITLLLSDALRSERQGTSLSESLLKQTFEKEIKTTHGKFIVTVMSSNLHRVQQAVDVAAAHGRSIAFLGRSIEQNVKTAQKQGFLKLPHKIIYKRKINKVDPKKLCVIIAGSQGQEGSSLRRAIAGEHKLISINPQDKVVFATEPIPGNELNVYEAIDNVLRLGTDIAYPETNDETLHVSGHASADELKKLITLTKPKYLLPIGGSYRHLVQYRKLAQTLGYDKNKVFILKVDQTLEVANGKAHLGKEVRIKKILVDGLGIGDVGNIVLSDRRQMAESGIVIVAILVDKNNGQLIGSPEIISRGFVFMKHSKGLINQIKKETSKYLRSSKGKVSDWKSTRRKIEIAVEKLLYVKTERHPLILTAVIKI